MNDTYILAPFSDEWILWNAVTSIFIFILVYFGGNLSKESNSTLVKVMLAVMIFEYVGIQAYYLDKGYWTVQSSLPFHLCRIMWFNAIVVLITRNQLAFELLLFIGMVGGFHSLLTPELTHGADIVLLIDYFLVHGGLVAVPLFCIFGLGMRPRRFSWIKSFVYFQVLVFLVAIIDYFLGANYMYLAEKPNVNNPLLMGPWPYYILVLQLVTLLHASLIYLPFYLKKSFFINE